MSATFSRPGGEPQWGPAVPARDPAEILREFRGELYRCLTRRGDALFELGDAVLCRQDRVQMLAELSLEPEHQRGHGALYDALNWSVQIARLRWALAAVPLPAWEVLGRLGTNRVLRQAPPPRQPGQMGRPVRHGRELKLSDDAACPGPDVHTTTETSRYGTARARAWHRMHPRLKARGAWEGHQGELPVIEGTLIKLTVGHLPHDGDPKPVWLRTSEPAADADEVNRCWQAFLRRFDQSTCSGSSSKSSAGPAPVQLDALHTQWI